MRFNSWELKQLAISSSALCTKEGLLSLREKEGKLWNKTDVLTERWCRLIGNLLFYMKGKTKSSEPSGVFVLEQFTVRAEEQYSFVLEFEGDDRSIYFLACKPSVASDWIRALQGASYAHLKQRYEELTKEAENLRAQASSNAALELSLRCSDLQCFESYCGPSTMLSVQYNQQSHGFWNQHAQTDVVPGTSQPNYAQNIIFHTNENIQVTTQLRLVVYRMLNTDKFEELGSCYCFVEDLVQNKNVLTFHLQKEGDYTGCLHVNVIQQNITPKNVVKKNKSGKTIVSVDESVAESVKQSTERIQQFGTLTSNPVLQTMYDVCKIISRTYRFPLEDGGKVDVQELMLETCLSFHIPILFLKICIDEETKKLATLEFMGKLSGNWEMVRQRKITTHKKYLEKYQTRLEYLMLKYRAPYFKKSADKLVEELDFVPTNLHLQRMRVENIPHVQSSMESSTTTPSKNTSNTSWTEYDIVTVGATAIHSMGFKQGGLLTLLTNVDEGGKSKKSLPLHPIAHCLKRGLSSSDDDQLLLRIMSLREQIKYQIEKLRTLISQTSSKSTTDVFSADKVAESCTALACLSQKVCELVTCCDSNMITRSVTALAEARPAYKPLYEDYQHGPPSSPQSDPPGPSMPVDGEQGNVSFTQSVVGLQVNTPLSKWEDQNCSAKSMLSNVVKSVHRVITPNLEESFLRGNVSTDLQYQKAYEDLSSLQEVMEKIYNETTSALAFINLKETNNWDADLIYRRNAVFSQSLSLCICGVSTLIASSIDDDLKLYQFAEVGIFLQVESLVSTYGNELGMLQDYAVGVMDLSNVTFTCVQASQQQKKVSLSGGSILNEKYLPSIYGSIDGLTVKLPLDDESFKKLPLDLQKGKLIKIFPAIYNVGINEEQTLAEKFGNTSLQDYLNMESMKRTLEYYDMIRDRCPSCIAETLRNANSFIKDIPKDKMAASFPDRRKSSPVVNETNEQRPLMDLMSSLSAAVHAKRNKNVEVLRLASDICHRLNGVRVASCKSAKDRTAMAVTLEQARILANEHDLARNMFSQALSCMRSQGTRRENTLKNTGARKYAFTSVQLMTFPKLYKPPDGTYGKGES